MRINEGLRPLLFSLGAAGLVLGAFLLATKSPARAAPAATLWILLILSYGQVYDALKILAPALGPWVRHRYLLPVLVVLWLVITIRLVRADSPALANRSFTSSPLWRS